LYGQRQIKEKMIRISENLNNWRSLNTTNQANAFNITNNEKESNSKHFLVTESFPPVTIKII
jgi:hypothetical protein